MGVGWSGDGEQIVGVRMGKPVLVRGKMGSWTGRVASSRGKRAAVASKKGQGTVCGWTIHGGSSDEHAGCECLCALVAAGGGGVTAAGQCVTAAGRGAP